MVESKGMSFDINEEVSTEEEGLGSNLGVGIHRHVYLTKVEYNVPAEGDVKAKWEESLDFTFVCKGTNVSKDKHGNVITDAQSRPITISRAGETALIREFFSPSKTDAAKQAKMLSRIKHILLKFMPEKEVIVKGKSFEDLSKNVIKLLEGKYENTELVLKVIKNNKYSQVPKYMPFVERADLKLSKLQLSKKEIEGEAPSAMADLEGSMDIEMPDLEV